MAHEFAKGRIGTTLRGKYRLDALLGVGGMAAVYRGAHRNGNRVAVKMLHPELSTVDDLRARFLKEGYVANAVDHPGAVRVLDDDVTEDGSVFLVMELLEGETLDALWRRRDPPRMRARDVASHAAQILATLAAAHAQGIVHRDIKPENLFLTNDGQVKILDFGIARIRAANAESATRTGRMLGTPAYMPPEQALGLIKKIDGRTDLWALGATMFALISGRHVHEAETLESMMVFTATRPARPLAIAAPDAPVALMGVVDRALSFAQEDRYADAPAMLSALGHAYASAFGSALPGSPSRTAARAEPEPATASIVKDHNVRAAAAGLAADPTMLASVPVPVPALAPIVPAAVLKAAPGHPMISPLAVSTTAGMSSGYGRAMAAHDAAQAVPLTKSSGSRVAIIVAVFAIAFAAAGTVALVARTKMTSASGTVVSASADKASVPPLTTGAASPPVVDSAAAAALPSAAAFAAPSVASIPETAAPVASKAPPSPRLAPRPTSVRLPREGDVPPKPSAEPDCNPPFRFDPVTGQKKVKPGC